MKSWQVLEEIPGLTTLRQTWQSLVGERFPQFRILCLQSNPKLPGVYPCSRNRHCHREIISRHDRAGVLAVCSHKPPLCPDLLLTIDEITPLEVDREKLARALAKAFSSDFKFVDQRLPRTFQFGSVSPECVPLILSIPYKTYPVHGIMAQLALKLRRPYILFLPTSDFIDADCQELLADANAGFYSLDATVGLNPDGSLRARIPPSQLFARFMPNHDLAAPLLHLPPPRYALRKGLGVWYLTFDGKDVVLKHEQGIFYVAWLLYHPPEHPIHAIDLMTKIPTIFRHQLGLLVSVQSTLARYSRLSL